ncbi:component of IIS longevity pathway SMK-1-domain-containing protein [Lentinula boryana]|uniref:Component of IIS longevity pathway SMK-1-domain-containing protein n=1 Tax=Lentinula boryana TaxID=40481 RepID=A0ABQ8QH84_9AGAR|nr:component of IIS longevity pathway SMK-1-domain-containing protein [Lentinula boryana]
MNGSDNETIVMTSALHLIPLANDTEVAAGLSAPINSTNDALSLDFPASQIHDENNDYTALTDGNSSLSLSEQNDLLPIKHEDEGLDLTAGQVEMLEPDGEPGNDSGGTGVVSDDEQEYLQSGDHEMKRVKVYVLVGSQWMDRGTAFCFGHTSEDGSEALLTARSEKNMEDIILSTTIRTTDVYQRQQETLIVWTEPDGVDYALSFQDSEGCAEVWSFIVDIQRHMSGATAEEHGSITLDPSSPLPEPSSIATAAIIRTGHLPNPHMGMIGEIDKAIKTLARTQPVKEKICEYIQNEDYIKQLIKVLHQAEESESITNLHALCSLMQTILMLNDHGIYDLILEDDYFFHVCGMLEYDPDFPAHKANFREFLLQGTRYHEPVLIRDFSIHRKIHHTYRLQFLKDVVLARILDDSTFNVLNSSIIFNQMDIIQHVQQDNAFLRDIVKLYVDEDMLSGGGKKAQAQQHQLGPKVNGQLESSESSDPATASNPANEAQPPPKDYLPLSTSSPQAPTPSQQQPYSFAPPEDMSEAALELRRSVIYLIQHLCVMGRNVQLPARLALFRTLVDRGVLFAIQWALGLSEKEPTSKAMISAGGEVLAALLDHDLGGVRGHVLKQVVAIDKERAAGKRGADKAETIVELCCRNLSQSKDLAVQSQIGDALKVWLDVPLATDNFSSGGSEATQAMASKMTRKDEPGTERFIEYFYKHCVQILFKPLYDLPDWRDVTDSIHPLAREQTNRYVYLCDMLYNFSLQHQFRSHFYILSTNVVLKIASLLKAKEKHLRHAAFRVFRLLLKQNNHNTMSQFMKHDILKPILDLTIQESQRDNLLSCSCQEFFEHMRRENMKELIGFCLTKHEAEIKTLTESHLGGQRFQLFIRRWEMNNEPMPVESKSEKTVDARGWPVGSRALEAEEEDYFNGDDDDDDFVPAISHSWSRGNGASSPIPNSNGLKRKRRMAVAGAQSNKVTRPNNLPLRPQHFGSLVDYEDDEEPVSIDITEDPSASSSRSPNVPPSSPKLTNRQISSPSNGFPPKRLASVEEEEEEEDNMLEALVSRSRPQSPAPGMMVGADSLGPMRPGEKRRRNDDDEDDEELLDRLSKASKKPDLGKQKDSSGGLSISLINRNKTGDDPPKKFKLKIGAAKTGSTTLSKPPSPSSATPPPSQPGAKNGDTG